MFKQKLKDLQAIFNKQSLNFDQMTRLQLYIEQCFHLIKQINTMGNLGLFDFLEGELKLIIIESDPLHAFFMKYIRCHTERTSYESLIYSIELLEAELPSSLLKQMDNRKILVTLKYVTRFIYEADEKALYEAIPQMINPEDTSKGNEEIILFKIHLIHALDRKELTVLHPQLEADKAILENKILSFTDGDIQNFLRASLDKSISVVLAICSEAVESKILANASPLMGFYLKEAALDLVFMQADYITLRNLLKQVMERVKVISYGK